ncbi:MAG: tetratricopeptide repeat protein [Thiobacillus sp.]|nr:tetratricopeptide repeat protein [Thiobacillus sp.]
MSIINQMLRELDARGAAASDAPAVPVRVPVKKRALGMPVAAGLMAVAVGGLGYWVMIGTPDQPLLPAPAPAPAPAMPMPPRQDLITRAIAPSVAQVPLPLLPSPQRVVLVAVPDTRNSPAIPLIQMARSLSIDSSRPPLKAESTNQQSAVLSVQAHIDPADSRKSTVIKKMTELSPEDEAQQLLEEAQALRRAGKLGAAVGKYQQALARDPGMRLARLQLAELLQGRGQADEALQVLKIGYERQPNDRLAIAAGRLLADQGKRDEALNWLTRGHDGLRPTDFALMGALLSQAQRFDESAKAYQRALAADPDQGGWLLGLGVSLESLGRMDEARVAYRKALEHGEFKPEVVEFLQQKKDKAGL